MAPQSLFRTPGGATLVPVRGEAVRFPATLAVAQMACDIPGETGAWADEPKFDGWLTELHFEHVVRSEAILP